MTINPFSLDTVADSLLRFMAQQDQLDDAQSKELAEYLKEQERTCITDAEKRFLLAARSFVLDYPAELEDNR